MIVKTKTMSKPENEDPFQPWNDPMYQDDPFAPHNDPIREDDPAEPWNNVFGTYEDLSDSDARYYGIRRVSDLDEDEESNEEN